MTLSEWLDATAAKISRPEAKQILESVLGLSREQLHSASNEPLTEQNADDANAKLSRRETGEPLAYVVGKKEFYGREFAVNKSVLIPRPETELLTEAALKIIQPNWTCIDVGTGCGCIGITLALETNSRWIATDISPEALQAAKENTQNAQVHFLQSDLLTAFKHHSANLIISNPPYIANNDPRVEAGVQKWEPKKALYAGETGMEAIKSLIEQATDRLKPNGWLAFEFGMGQADAIKSLLKNWEHTIHRDLAGIERFALAQSPS